VNRLKGRCSTTELRPYMALDSLVRLNILHGNKFADLGGIAVAETMPKGILGAVGSGIAMAASAAGSVATT
jgi:hypothetical protein